MKRLTCEMCSSNEIIRQNGMYVCQSCGTKYSIEDARKMMIEGPVDVSGSTVRIDQTDEINNLYEIARRARNDGNSDNAQKYYEMILIKDPSSWEANFFSVYYQSMNCKLGELELAANRLSKCIVSVCKLINENVSNDEENRDDRAKMDAVKQVSSYSLNIAHLFYSTAVNHFNSIGSSIRNNYLQEVVDNCLAATNLCYTCGDCIAATFGQYYANAYSVPCWKEGINQHRQMIGYLKSKNGARTTILHYVAKVQEFESDYKTPSLPKDGACYVATAVYGSYDCPEVWTLRRFRDYRLAKTGIGRIAIKIYYTVSPYIVRRFGNTKLFSCFIRKRLDRFVEHLNTSGIENTPYSDVDY